MRGRPRRAKGEGGIYERKDGRGWGGSVVINGVRTSFTRPTKADVALAIEQAKRGGIASGKGTFADYLDSWLEDVRLSARPKTYESYEAVVRLWLKPTCGKVPIAKLGPQHINRAVAAARDANLSSSSYAYVRIVARVALNRAKKHGLVTQNAAAMASAVRVERKEYVPFTDEEFVAFIEGIQGDRFEAAYLLAVLMGPRRGEIVGLKWSDIAERPNADGTVTTTIRIARQVQRVNGRLVVSSVKTDKGRREYALPPEIVDALTRRKREQLEDRMKAGAAWVETGHIFTTVKGTLLEPRKLLRLFQDILAKRGITRRPFHGLRHEAATSQLAAGTPMKAITAMLGHSSERFTSERYTHMVPSIEAQVTATASARLKAAKKG